MMMLNTSVRKGAKNLLAKASQQQRALGSTPFDLYNPTDEHRALRQMVRKFAEDEVDPQALEFNRQEKFNIDLYRKLGDLGLLGLTVPTKYGGSEMDCTAVCTVHEELAASDPAFCLSYLAHSLLFVNNLTRNGSEEQKQKWLPDSCSGKIIGGMGMSEPNHGTDVLGLQTSATKDGDDYILKGSKMWITNGCVDDNTLGDIFLVYARTGPRAISLFLVEKGMPGFSLGQRIKDKCGMRASATAELVFDEVRVPAANLVGEEGGAVLCMMRNLEVERIALGAMSCGIARRSFEIMNQYAKDRVAFGQPLTAFGQIQKYIGESYSQYMAGRAYTYDVAQQIDLDNSGNRLATDGVKLFTTTMGKIVADNAIQVLGGAGYIGDYQVERLWRDAKLLEIGGGTLESHHKNMVRELSKISKIE
mmetsp:Transcript_11547/g.22711  ORF Transcript_11547/g.22711 Transcript_11547/m.22711 type:complete len:419 (+) Transcript_11547:120-1376(+)